MTVKAVFVKVDDQHTWIRADRVAAVYVGASGRTHIKFARGGGDLAVDSSVDEVMRALKAWEEIL